MVFIELLEKRIPLNIVRFCGEYPHFFKKGEEYYNFNIFHNKF